MIFVFIHILDFGDLVGLKLETARKYSPRCAEVWGSLLLKGGGHQQVLLEYGWYQYVPADTWYTYSPLLSTRVVFVLHSCFKSYCRLDRVISLLACFIHTRLFTSQQTRMKRTSRPFCVLRMLRYVETG
jgi:hypothetical protein